MQSVSYDPTRRIDSPTDFKILWMNLERRLKDMAAGYAQLTAVERDDITLRQNQGAYTAIAGVQEEMRTLLQAARGDRNP